MKKWIMLGFGFLAVIALLLFSSGGSESSNLPSYATTHPKIQEAYEFALAYPEALTGVNCYCGCMQHQHSGRIHSRGLIDCYLKEDGSFEEHASQCDMCINDALEVKEMFMSGASHEEIKAAIDAKYN